MALVTLSWVGGCQRAVRRFSGNAAAGIVDRVVAQPDSTVELLEAELRWMEDNLYRMDDELDVVLLQLDSARRDNAVLRLELAEARGDKKKDAQPNAGSFDNYSENIDLSPPVVIDENSVLRADSPTDSDSYTESDYENSFEPEIDYGKSVLIPSASSLKHPSEQNGAPASDEDESNAGKVQSATPETSEAKEPSSSSDDKDTADLSAETGVQLEAMPDPKFMQPSEEIETPKPSPSSDPFESRIKSYDAELRSVFRIKLNPQLTGGYNRDGRPGHDGVMVVIEPQNQKSEYVPVTGAVTVEVKDPAKSGVAGRVGKWTFDAIYAQQNLKRTTFGRGVHLEMPWPGAPPENQELELTVRYQLADGRTLQANKRIQVDPLTSVLVSKANAIEGKSWSPERPAQSRSQSYSSSAERQSYRRWLPNR